MILEKRYCRVICGIVLLLFCYSPAPAQAPLSGDSQHITVKSEVVNVDVNVVEARGNFVAGLAREQFHVFDDGAEQPITNFASIDVAVKILLLVETSPAVYLISRDHLTAAYELLNGLAPRDEVALATYDDQLHTVLPFSTDKARVAVTLGKFRYTLGTARLNLFASLSSALDELASIPGRSAIVLLTTGLDDSASDYGIGNGRSEDPSARLRSREWEQLAARLRAAGVVVYSVALGGDLREPARRKAGESESGAAAQLRIGFAAADRALREMAQLSGGLALFPRSPADLRPIYRHFSSALRHEYSLGFAPPFHDARYHRIEVRVLDKRGRQVAPAPGYHLRARPGYTSPSP